MAPESPEEEEQALQAAPKGGVDAAAPVTASPDSLAAADAVRPIVMNPGAAQGRKSSKKYIDKLFRTAQLPEDWAWLWTRRQAAHIILALRARLRGAYGTYIVEFGMLFIEKTLVQGHDKKNLK